MYRAPPWKQSLRSLLIAPLVAGLVPGCDAGEAPPAPAPPARARATPLMAVPTPKQIILEPEADTYVRAASPGVNYGTAQNLIVDSAKAETYLRFNLSGIPAGSHIASVVMQTLSYDGSSAGGDGSVYAHLVPDDTWSETGMTWNNRPAVSGDRLGSWWLWNPNTTPKPLQVGANFSPKLKAPVQQALDSDGLISFRLMSPGYHTVYRSREHGVASERPRLIINYFEPGDPQVTMDLQVVALYPQADAQVLSGSPTTNYGRSGGMTVDRTAAESFLRFGLGSVPENAQVVAVSLVATSNDGYAYDNADGNVYTRLVSDDAWSETGITWNNKPAASTDDLGSWLLWNRDGQYTTQVGINSSPKLVAPVQEALESDGMISLRLDSPGYRTNYHSREYSNTSARWPQLIVSYFVPPPCPTPVASAPTQVVLEPEADTYVWSLSPTTNYGANQNLWVDSGKGETYLRFNLGGIPAGSHIASVRLEALAYDGSSAGGDGSVYAHLVPDDTWSETGMTWNNRPPVTGSDLGSWWLWNSNSSPKPLQLGVNADAKLKAPVQQALDSDGLISFRLRSPGYHTVYRSREYGVASERPRLVVSYFEPGDPQVTTHLEAASFFPVADASVWMSNPNANAGASMALTVDRDDAETFLRFNLAALPPTAQVASVVLVTTATGSSDVTAGADGNVYMRWVRNNTWSEAGLTWNTKPSVFSCELGSWQLPARPAPYTTQAGINASPLLVPVVQEVLSMDGLLSLRLDSPGSRSVYDSREYSNTSARWPRLIVYYTLPTATP
ncbi:MULTISPECIES: CBM96 family carbohydrate-binding protein [unclassified Corallococcus]|uniref:CBM96 family carbohydrate-binding protein n=1 Tax=unclassified Corallococcus TaxID=2685029 RepID=UPI001A8DA2B3|nr:MULTISPECIES: DNRLRE domain-containing protein [unclassified Corallococcus]MBN9686983.1 DNRLRE domain-containing protein [Corallococcus sp. NCSPR001]WAS89185.1 DNRLRE domain-containing protein [Corallococcus sp. NCRR]